MRSVGHVARMGESRGVYRLLVEKPEGMRPLVRIWHRWEDNIKRIFKSGMWLHGLDRSGSGQGEMVGTCECRNEPSGSIKFGEFLETLRNG